MLPPNTGKVLVGTDVTVVKRIAIAVIVVCGLLAIFIIAGAGNCIAWFAVPVLCRSSLAVPLAVAAAALPLMAFAVSRSPLATFLGLYIVLVPIDDALLVGQGLTLTKVLGLLLGGNGLRETDQATREG